MLTYELTGIDELRQKFDPQMVNKALGIALQHATQKLRTRVSREVRQIYNIKAGDLSKSATIRRYTGGHMLIYAGRMVPLHKFSARATKRGKYKGVSVQVRKDRGRKVVKGGFMPGGNYIAKRVGKERLPIKSKFGISVAHMAGNEVVGNIALLQVQEDASKEFDRYLQVLMDKAK
jgi:hypothetical protein